MATFSLFDYDKSYIQFYHESELCGIIWSSRIVLLQANQKEEEERVAEIKVFHNYLIVSEKFHSMAIFCSKFKLESNILRQQIESQLQQIAIVTFSTFDVSSILLI